MAISARMIEDATFRFRATLVFIFLWGMSLLAPALHTQFDPGDETRVLLGYQVLTSGWIGLAYFQLGWLANPLLAVTLIGWASGPPSARTARWTAVALLVASLWTIDLPMRPRFHHHEGFGFGYWLWLANNLAAAGLVLRTTHMEKRT